MYPNEDYNEDHNSQSIKQYFTLENIKKVGIGLIILALILWTVKVLFSQSNNSNTIIYKSEQISNLERDKGKEYLIQQENISAKKKSEKNISESRKRVNEGDKKINILKSEIYKMINQ